MDTPYPAYQGDEPYVFVCYSHEDAAVVFPEFERLRESGINVYYDDGISPGHEWTQELADAIDGCSRFLFFVSTSSVDSRNCRNEIRYALDAQKPVISVHLEATELSGGLKLSLGATQAILKYSLTPEAYHRKVFSALDTNEDPTTLESPRSHPESADSFRVGRPSWNSWSQLVRIVVPVGFILLALSFFGWWYWQPSLPNEGIKEVSVPTIAVLPFTNIGDTEEYFGEGVAEEILNRIIQISDVRVISRNSSFAYKDSTLDIREIGDLLGADYLLQGSLRKSGNLVRISVRLAATEDGTELWERSFDRELVNILRLQDEVAQAAIGEFMPNVLFASSSRSKVDPVAYNLVLKARQALRANDPTLAKPLLESALAIDPNFGVAHGLLAVTLSDPRNFKSEGEIQSALDKALDLDPENLDVLALKINLQYRHDYNLQRALSSVESLIGQFPNAPTAFYQLYYSLLTIAVKTEEMRLVSERINELDPQSTSSALVEFQTLYNQGAFGQARRSLDRIPIKFVGGDCWAGRSVWLLTLDIIEGKFDAAANNLTMLKESVVAPEADGCIRIYENWLAIEQNGSELKPTLTDSPSLLLHNLVYYWLPMHIVASGDTSHTLEEIENPKSRFPMTWILRLQHRSRWVSEFGSPVFKKAFAALRQEPRYQKALKKYGIDDKTLTNIQVHTKTLLE